MDRMDDDARASIRASTEQLKNEINDLDAEHVTFKFHHAEQTSSSWHEGCVI